MLAAVRREVPPGAVGAAWGPAVGKVWDFIRSQSGLWTDGHNVFLYDHPKQPGARLLCDFGVEITRTFEPAGEVYATETPGGEAAVAVYCGDGAGLEGPGCTGCPGSQTATGRFGAVPGVYDGLIIFARSLEPRRARDHRLYLGANRERDAEGAVPIAVAALIILVPQGMANRAATGTRPPGDRAMPGSGGGM